MHLVRAVYSTCEMHLVRVASWSEKCEIDIHLMKKNSLSFHMKPSAVPQSSSSSRVQHLQWQKKYLQLEAWQLQLVGLQVELQLRVGLQVEVWL